jgi:hypothetical protein
VKATTAARDRQLAEARRFNARVVYNIRVNRFVRQHPGLATDDRMRVGRWNERTMTVEPVAIPPDLEELWRAGGWGSS